MKKINKNILIIILSIILIIGIAGYVFRDSLKKSVVFKKGETIVLKWFNISADTNSLQGLSQNCEVKFCSRLENYDSCRANCAGKNASIQTGVLFAGNRGIVSEADLNFIAKQHKLVVSDIMRPPITSNVTPPSSTFEEQNQIVAKLMQDAKRIKEISSSENPSLKILSYRISTRSSKWDLDVTDNSAWDYPIPEACFLHKADANGTTTKTPENRLLFGSAKSYYMDPSSDCWRNILATYYHNQLTAVANPTVLLGNTFFDGAFLDEATALPRANGELIDTDLRSNWDSLLSAELSAIKNSIKSVSSEKILMYNGIKCDPAIRWNGEKENCNAWKILNNPDIDGVMYETYNYTSHAVGDPSFQPYDIFKRQLDLAIQANSQGKMVLASSFISVPSGTDIRSESLRSIQRSVLSSYLLAQGDNTYYEVAIGDGGNHQTPSLPSTNINNDHYNFVGYFPDWNTDIGKPLDSYKESTDPVALHVFYRDFEKALVVYNADASAKTLFFDGTYTTPEGETISGNINLAANQGQILLKPSTADNTLPEIKSLNLTDGQTIKTNPYILMVTATDNVAINRVDFYVDDNLVGSSSLPDNNGVYETVWDTAKYHSTVRVEVIDSSGNITRLTRNTTVNLDTNITTPPIVIILPKTGKDSIWNQKIDDLVKDLVL